MRFPGERSRGHHCGAQVGALALTRTSAPAACGFLCAMCNEVAKRCPWLYRYTTQTPCRNVTLHSKAVRKARLARIKTGLLVTAVRYRFLAAMHSRAFAKSSREEVMEIRRTPTAFAIAALSLGLLAACKDKGADRPVSAPPEKVTPAPAPPPMDKTPPATSTTPAPGSGTTMPAPSEPASPPSGTGSGTTSGAVPGTTPAPSSSSVSDFTGKVAFSGQALQESARIAARSLGEKAGELRSATGERMTQVGHAIRKGAEKADATIQASLARGGEPTSNARPSVRQ